MTSLKLLIKSRPEILFKQLENDTKLVKLQLIYHMRASKQIALKSNRPSLSVTPVYFSKFKVRAPLLNFLVQIVKLEKSAKSIGDDALNNQLWQIKCQSCAKNRTWLRARVELSRPFLELTTATSFHAFSDVEKHLRFCPLLLAKTCG